MVNKTVSSLPSRPLTKHEVLSNENMAEYCTNPEAEEAYVVSLLGKNQVHALGYDAEAGGWVQFETAPMEFSEESADEYEAAILDWSESEFGDRLGDDGELEMWIDGEDTEDKVPWEVEQGLEPEYDCPDCEYYKTGLTTGPHAYLDHLEDEHDYSRSEASDILHG